MHVHTNDKVISQSNNIANNKSPLPYFDKTIPGRVSFRLISLTINSSSSTLHLRCGWNPLTKVIACAARVMCANEIVIERYYIFHIIANMRFCFLVMTGKTLLMSPKERNASRDGLFKLREGTFIVCNTITL